MQFPRYASSPSSASLQTKRLSIQGSVEDKNYVGIDQLQDQTKQRALRKGFVFNLMVVGRSGLGKSTLVDTLFKSSVAPKVGEPEDGESSPSSTDKIMSKTSLLNEKGVKLTLTVTDTPGFGDQVNNENCWEPAIQYINEQYSAYLKEELRIDRPAHILDKRVHCCLYFIQPSGHALTCLDIEVLKRLCKIVNVIPVIAKSDALNLEEREVFKERIRSDLAAHKISVFPDPNYEEEADKEENTRIRGLIPFAVVGSTAYHDVAGKKVLGRKTKWGLVEIENKQHSDFPALRDILIRSHMTDLVDVTSSYFFESFRKAKIETEKKQENGNQITENEE